MTPKIFVAFRHAGESEVVGFKAYKNKFQAKQAIKAYRKAHPGMQFDITKE